MITGTFGSWNLVAVPTDPVFSQVEFNMNDTVAAVTSPWTKQAQLLDWQTDWWDAKASLPVMPAEQALAWVAFLAQLRGISAAFLVGDPAIASPLGLARGLPVCDGVNAARASTLATRGWQPNLQGQLRAGDSLQIGYRLYTNLDDVASDASGKATLNLWPRLREAPADGDALLLRYPKGLFRLADNKRGYSRSVTKLFGISLDLVEAL